MSLLSMFKKFNDLTTVKAPRTQKSVATARQTTQIKPEPVTSVPIPPGDTEEDYYNFDQKYYKKCMAWEDRIERAAENEEDFADPDKNLKNYDKALTMAEELKEFCLSQKGGARFYEENHKDLIPGLQHDKKDYIDNYYQEEKELYNEIKETDALRKKVQNKILKAISEDVILQTEIKDRLTGKEQTIYESAIYNLMKDGKINKGHQGKKVIYTLAGNSNKA